MFSCSVMSDSFWSHGVQHARLPCPSLSTWVLSNSCPWIQWCHPIILSFVIPFSSCPQSFPASRSFSMSQHHRLSKYWNFHFSISSSNVYSWLISFKIDWFDLLAIQRTLKYLLKSHSLKASILWPSAFFMVQLIHPYMTIGKTIALTIWIFVGKVMPLVFNILSRASIFLYLGKERLSGFINTTS